MEINCSSVKLTTIKHSLLMCAGGETALVASMVSALVKAQLVVSVLSQEYMKLLRNQPKLRGDQHISCPCKPLDAEDDDGDEDEDGDDDGDEDEDGDDDANDEEDGTPTDGNKTSAKNGPAGGAGKVEENGEEEDDDEQESGEDPNDDEDDDDDDEDDEEDDGEEEGDEEDEEEDEEEEALQPPKKRKK